MFLLLGGQWVNIMALPSTIISVVENNNEPLNEPDGDGSRNLGVGQIVFAGMTSMIWGFESSALWRN